MDERESHPEVKPVQPMVDTTVDTNAGDMYPFNCTKMDIHCTGDNSVETSAFSEEDIQKESNIQCSVCEAQYDNMTEYTHHLNMHLQEQSGTNANKCTKVSDKSYKNSKESVTKRPRRGGKEKPFSCTVCKRKYFQKHSFDKHFLIVHKNVETCNICHKQFSEKSELRKHFNSAHLKPNQFSCTSCNKTHLTKHGLSRHVLTKHTLCPQDKGDTDVDIQKTGSLCQKQCTEKLGLQEGNRNTHKESNPLSCKCTLCEKSFSDKEYLFKHLYEAHVKQKAFSCTLCDKSFVTKLSLTSHVATVHENKPKPFSCALCAKSFSEKGTLKFHINTVHHKLKHFTCTWCDKQFATKRLMVQHTNFVHYNLKLFSCPLCDKSFSTKGNLKVHVDAIHRKQNNLFCTFCDKSFAYKRELNRHVNAVHCKLRPFTCTLCYRSFSHKYVLSRHVAFHCKLKWKRESFGYKCKLTSNIAKRIKRLKPMVQQIDQIETKPESFTKKNEKAVGEEFGFLNEDSKHLQFQEMSDNGVPKRSNEISSNTIKEIDSQPGANMKEGESSQSQSSIGQGWKVNAINNGELSQLRMEALVVKNRKVHKEFRFLDKGRTKLKFKEESEDKVTKEVDEATTCTNNIYTEMNSQLKISKKDGTRKTNERSDLTQQKSKLKDVLCNRHLCPFCSKAFHCKNKVIVHVASCPYKTGEFLSYTNSNVLIKATEIEEALIKHVDTGDLLKCSLCKRQFYRQQVLDKHVYQDHIIGETKDVKMKSLPRQGKGGNIEPFRVKTETHFHHIDALCPAQPAVKSPKSPVEPALSFSCTKCNQTFALKRDLKRHMKIHLFNCTLCKQQIDTKEDLYKHLNSVHTFSCTLCEKSFSKEKLLSKHLRMHNSKESFSCHLCEKQLSCKRTLKKHLDLHKKADSIFCNLCGQSFTEMQTYEGHVCAI